MAIPLSERSVLISQVLDFMAEDESRTLSQACQFVGVSHKTLHNWKSHFPGHEKRWQQLITARKGGQRRRSKPKLSKPPKIFGNEIEAAFAANPAARALTMDRGVRVAQRNKKWQVLERERREQMGEDFW